LILVFSCSKCILLIVFVLSTTCLVASRSATQTSALPSLAFVLQLRFLKLTTSQQGDPKVVCSGCSAFNSLFTVHIAESSWASNELDFGLPASQVCIYSNNFIFRYVEHPFSVISKKSNQFAREYPASQVSNPMLLLFAAVPATSGGCRHARRCRLAWNSRLLCMQACFFAQVVGKRVNHSAINHATACLLSRCYLNINRPPRLASLFRL
jgi:hypothetical protein